MSTPIAVCFFGITRSLHHTLGSVESHVLAPARATPHGAKTYAHFFQQGQIHNPRTGETGALDDTEHKLLKLDQITLEAPDACLAQWNFEALKPFGDIWETGFTSLRNLVHQLHSLDRVTQMALDDGAEVAIFARPDLHYHDSLAKPLKAALKAHHHRTDTVAEAWLPWWQQWFGLNDRFAICAGQGAIAAYGQRVRLMQRFCASGPQPMHAEKLLAYALAEKQIKVHKMGMRASRVRAGGEMVDEEFTHPIPRKIGRGWSKAMRLSGLRAVQKKLR